MKDNICIVIADDNVEFGDLLYKNISKETDIQVLGVARDGVQALSMVLEMQPDVVILDLIMPNLDGLGVLEKMRDVPGSKPQFIVLTAIGQEIYIQKAMALGAEYYVIKPFDIDVLVTRIRQVYSEKDTSLFSKLNMPLPKPEENVKQLELSYDLEMEVTTIMREMCISPHMMGYQYLREAVIQTVKDPKTFESITRVLYPTVAEKFGTTPQKVERAIRNAIDNAWLKGSQPPIQSFFRLGRSNEKIKPTSSEVIAMIADKIRVGGRW